MACHSIHLALQSISISICEAGKQETGKVVIGKTRYLLNIVLCTWMFESSFFRVLCEAIYLFWFASEAHQANHKLRA
jgi:hypothetical protein